MRLPPIENPKNLFVKAAYWFSKRMFGKVIAPMKVIYARKPPLLFVANKIYRVQEKSFVLEPNLRTLITTLVSMLNGCSFCNDISLAQGVKNNLGAEKFFALGTNAEPSIDLFAENELAIIAFVREYFHERKVSDETFAQLQKHFNETEIVEIVAMNAFEHYFNAFAIPLEIESDNLLAIAENKMRR